MYVFFFSSHKLNRSYPHQSIFSIYSSYLSYGKGNMFISPFCVSVCVSFFIFFFCCCYLSRAAGCDWQYIPIETNIVLFGNISYWICGILGIGVLAYLLLCLCMCYGMCMSNCWHSSHCSLSLSYVFDRRRCHFARIYELWRSSEEFSQNWHENLQIKIKNTCDYYAISVLLLLLFLWIPLSINTASLC